MPKTIAILAPSAVPFQLGGSEKFWWGLREALAEWSGAIVELIKLPCREDSFADLIDSYEMFSKLKLDHFDMLISTKYPAWMAPHPNHVCYMQHALRGLYDLYHFTGRPEEAAHPGISDLLALLNKMKPGRDDVHEAFGLLRRALNSKSLPQRLFDLPGPLIRKAVHFFDRAALAPTEIKAYLAISETVARRGYLPDGARVKILPHPSDLKGFLCGEGGYFFTASRLNSTKRVALLVDAMAHMPLDIPLKIAGTGPDLAQLKQRAANDKRIQFLGHVTDAELPRLYAGAIAVPFVPMDEDYGLITIEAMKSAKPVVTATDSGGVCEFTRHEETGLIVEPTPKALGAALARLGARRDEAAAMGLRARASVNGINWRATASGLLEHVFAPPSGAAIVIAAPFAADAHGAGGPRRLYHFCAELAKKHQATLVCYGSHVQAGIHRRQLGPGFFEVSLPWPEAMEEEAARLGAKGASADDMAIMRHCANDPALLAELGSLGKNAACAILSHPWLYGAVKKALPGAPLALDAHNVEADLKAAMLDDSSLAAEAAAVEAAACQNARIVFTCSEEDMQRLAQLCALDGQKLRLAPHGCSAPANAWHKKSLRSRLAYPDARLAIFIGSGHMPNLEAAHAIFELAAAVPECEFLLAGTVSTQPETRGARRPANAHLLGVVSEASKDMLLKAADVALNPISSGSGANLKLLEYLAYGLPVISTPFGMRGAPRCAAAVAHVCRLADFPGKLRELLANPVAASEEARQKIAAALAWPRTLAPLLPAIEAILGQEAECDS